MVELIHINQNAESIAARHERQQRMASLDAQHKYLFAEDGFEKAKENAVEIARLQQIQAADDENAKIIESANPSTSVRSIDGRDNAPDSSFKL